MKLQQHAFCAAVTSLWISAALAESPATPSPAASAPTPAATPAPAAPAPAETPAPTAAPAPTTAPPATASNTAFLVEQCLEDNKDEEESRTVVKAYCECVAEKMGPNEKQSISAWETDHIKEAKVCAKKAGWK